MVYTYNCSIGNADKLQIGLRKERRAWMSIFKFLAF